MNSKPFYDKIFNQKIPSALIYKHSVTTDANHDETPDLVTNFLTGIKGVEPPIRKGLILYVSDLLANRVGLKS